MNFTDTHCHIHEAQQTPGGNPLSAKWLQGGKGDPDELIADARAAGVNQLICVGCTLGDSALAVDFVQDRPGLWASIGLHPHEAKFYAGNQEKLEAFAALVARPKVVAIGECGLDFYYSHSPKADQEKILRFQLELARRHDLPLIFHVRDAFEEFWPIFDAYPGTRGVIHSFSATEKELAQVLERGLYVGLNGIMTFTKDALQLAAAKAVPDDHLLLETDAPFLTPAPYRGKICEPKHVRVTAEFLASLREQPLSDLAEYSSSNAQALFGLK